MQDDELEDVIRPFQVPFGPPFPQGPPFPVRGAFLRSGEPGGSSSETDDILLRKVPRETAQRFRAAAGGRGMTHAQYLAALVELHSSARALAEAGDTQITAELERLGLQSVSV